MFTWYDRLAADDYKSLKFMFSKYHWAWLEKKTQVFPVAPSKNERNLLNTTGEIKIYLQAYR